MAHALQASNPYHSGFTPLWPRPAMLLMLLLLWAISLWNLDRFPIPYHDETVILSPGYKFVAEGVFGSDQLTGFYGMDTHFVQFMPVFPVMQGVAVRLFGIGAFQLRALPVMISAVTLCLVYAVAARLFGRQAAMWAAILLVTWQWSAGGDRWVGTGIPFLDFGRSARYDMLTALWGLTALWHFMQARESGNLWRYFFSGVFAGLAGLSHIYGFFFGPALLMILLIEKLLDRRRPLIGVGAVILVGILATALPWFVQVARHWQDFLGQQTIIAERFDLFDLRFYWKNVLNERLRYLPAMSDPATYLRAGTWLLLIGAPFALLRLAYLGLWKRERRPLWSATTYAVVASLFALFLPWNRVYLPVVLTLLTIVVSSFVAWLFRSSRRWVRYAAVCFIAVLIAQGAWSIVTLHTRQAASLRRTDDYMAEIRALIPPSSTVLGMSNFWLATPEPSFRSVMLPMALSDKQSNPDAISLTEAMERIAPDYIIMDQEMVWRFEFGSATFRLERSKEFQDYLDRHRATVVGVVSDAQGEPIEIYRLDQD